MDVTPLSDPKPTPGRKSRRKMLGLALALTVGSLPAIGTMGQPRATLSTAEAAARRRRKPKRRQRRPKFKVVTRTFTDTNPEAITIPGAGASGPAARYPSTIRVDGLTGGRIEKVTVSMRLVYSKPDELDIMLVGPTNKRVILMSDAGGATLAEVDLTFDQDGPGVVPDVLTSGVFQPSNYPAALDTFPAPAPGGVTGHSLTVFNGANPNGEWQLFVNDDDETQGVGALFRWSLTIRARVRVR